MPLTLLVLVLVAGTVGGDEAASARWRRRRSARDFAADDERWSTDNEIADDNHHGEPTFAHEPSDYHAAAVYS